MTERRVGTKVFREEALSEFLTDKELLVTNSLTRLLPKHQQDFLQSKEYAQLEIDRTLELFNPNKRPKWSWSAYPPLGELAGYSLAVKPVLDVKHKLMTPHGIFIVASKIVETSHARLSRCGRLIEEVAGEANLDIKDSVSGNTLDDKYALRDSYEFILTGKQDDLQALIFVK